MQIIKCILILILVFATACQGKNPENSALKDKIPEVEDISKNLNYIFTNGFYFTDELGVDRIGVHRIDGNRYKLFYFLSDRKHLEKVQDLNIAFRVYPEDPTKFTNIDDQKAEARTIATDCNLKRMGDAFVVSTGEFIIAPKTFKESKIYLYNPDSGVVGKTMTILDLNFNF